MANQNAVGSNGIDTTINGAVITLGTSGNTVTAAAGTLTGTTLNSVAANSSGLYLTQSDNTVDYIIYTVLQVTDTSITHGDIITCKSSASNDGYEASLATDTISWTAGGTTNATSSLLSNNTNYVISYSYASGSALKIYLNGTQEISVTPSSYTTPSTGTRSLGFLRGSSASPSNSNYASMNLIAVYFFSTNNGVLAAWQRALMDEFCLVKIGLST